MNFSSKSLIKCRKFNSISERRHCHKIILALRDYHFWKRIVNFETMLQPIKSFLLLVVAAILFSKTGLSQKISGRLSFDQAQTIGITISVKSTFSQEAMGQAIDFLVDARGYHTYKVTNSTDDNTTLHHEMKRVSFNFEGGGQKRSFDSENKKDIDGMFGTPIKEMLAKTYDMVIDRTGKTLLVQPENIQLSKADDRLVIVTNMLKDITSIVYPPKKNEASFFMVLPGKEVGIGDAWSESGEDAGGKYNTTYTLSAITDTTVIVALKGSSTTITKAEVMGTETSTKMNNSYTGNIILDRSTAIMKEKTIAINSTGTTEMMGGSIPVTSKTTITVRTAKN